MAGAFLGNQAFRTDGLSEWSYASAVAFLVVIVVVVYVNLPRTFVLSNDAKVMLEQWDLENLSPDDTTRHLAGHLADNAARNQTTIDRMTRAYVSGLFAFVAEVAFLFANVALR